MARESHILDGLDLTSGGILELADTPVFTPAANRDDWVGGVDSDGTIPVDEGRGENATLLLPLRVKKQATADLAWAKLGLVIAKHEALRRSRIGLTHLWTPKDMTSTWQLTARRMTITEFPMNDRDSMMGYLRRFPRITVLLTCDPFLYRQGELIGDILDDFSSNTIANYAFDDGVGTIAVSGGQLVPSTTASKRLYYNAATSRFSSAWVTWKFTTGVSVASYQVFVVLKRLDSTNYLMAGVESSGGALLGIYAINAGVTTLKNSVGRSLTASTSYWLRARQEGDLLTVEFWTSAPTTTGTPTTTVSYTLAGADATKFGALVVGDVGLRTDPGGTDWRYDDLLIEPNTVKSSEPVFSTSLVGVPGHVDAEATVTVTDAATQTRRHVEWGLGDGSAGALLIDSASLVTTGFAGVATTRTGAYSASGVIRATLGVLPQAVCGTGNLTHVGVLRPKARVHALEGVWLRLAYRTADNAYSYTPWVTPPVSEQFCEVAFGPITIGEVTTGLQQWDGRIEAYSPDLADLDVDYLEMLDADRWGRARGVYTYEAGAVVGRDEFDGITPAAVLNARVAPLGGTWATSGATTDFVGSAGIGSLSDTVSRSTINDTGVGRFAVLSTSYTNVEVAVDAMLSAVPGPGITGFGVVARYVNATNYLRFIVDHGTMFIIKNIAGTESNVAFGQSAAGVEALVTWRVRLVVFAGGRGIASVIDVASGRVMASVEFYDATLATGGALATGKAGVVDFNNFTSVVTRHYDNVYIATPPAEPVAIHSGRLIEVRHDATERQNAAGTVYGKPKSYTGGRAFVPAAGSEARASRVWCKARRNDIDVTPDDNIADATKLKVSLRPRYRMPTSP